MTEKIQHCSKWKCPDCGRNMEDVDSWYDPKMDALVFDRLCHVCQYECHDTERNGLLLKTVTVHSTKNPVSINFVV